MTLGMLYEVTPGEKKKVIPGRPVWMRAVDHGLDWLVVTKERNEGL